MTQYLSKAALKHALLDLHETTVDSPLLGGAVLVREPTALEKTGAVEASRGEDADAPVDEVIARAFILQRCILDPETGEADSAGRIDPRTRAPLFTPDEVNDLIHTRERAMSLLYLAIAQLGAMLPDAFRDGNQATDDAGADPGAGVSEDAPADRGDS
jgi:hypothetical protein